MRKFIPPSAGLSIAFTTVAATLTILGVPMSTAAAEPYQDVATDFCLDSNTRRHVYTYDCNGGDYQNWERRGHTLKNVATGFCLDSNTRREVYTHDCNDGDYQNWERRGHTLKNVATGFCLDSNTRREVYTHDCNDGDYQNWGPPTSASTPIAAHDRVREILELVNKERHSAGVGPLTLNGNLTDAAQRHTQDMADHNLFAHVGSNGSKPSERVQRAGYNWSTTAENIAKGTNTSMSKQAMSLWMNSPGHRKNLLNPGYREIGVGYAYNGREHYWTQDFGSRR